MTDKRPLFFLLVIIFLLFGWWALAADSTLIGFAFLGAALIITLVVSTVCVLDSRASLFEAKANLAKYLISLDPQGRDMVDITWPRLHLRMNNGASLTVDDSGVELLYFRKFLNASNAVYIVAQRTYNDKTIERAQWRLWQKYLLLEGSITEVRAQNETWRWSNPEEWVRYKMMYVDLKIPPELLPKQTDAPYGTQPIPANDEIERAFK
jgi:hypothetical protein